jgi:hypothetical protein
MVAGQIIPYCWLSLGQIHLEEFNRRIWQSENQQWGRLLHCIRRRSQDWGCRGSRSRSPSVIARTGTWIVTVMTLGEFDRAKINNEEGFCTVYVEDLKTGASVVASHILLVSLHGQEHESLPQWHWENLTEQKSTMRKASALHTSNITRPGGRGGRSQSPSVIPWTKTWIVTGMALGEFDRAKINNEEGFCTVHVEDHKTGTAVIAGQILLLSFDGREHESSVEWHWNNLTEQKSPMRKATALYTSKIISPGLLW